jgi:hypothetical protein
MHSRPFHVKTDYAFVDRKKTLGQTDRQTIGFIEVSIEAGILLGTEANIF